MLTKKLDSSNNVTKMNRLTLINLKVSNGQMQNKAKKIKLNMKLLYNRVKFTVTPVLVKANKFYVNQFRNRQNDTDLLMLTLYRNIPLPNLLWMSGRMAIQCCKPLPMVLKSK